MQIGFGAPVSGAWATPENLAAFAARAEKAGYATLWSFQRLIVPDGSTMDPVYQDVLDPYAALAYAAAVTRTIRLGVAIVNLPFVSPGYLAKQAASLDVLSAGARPARNTGGLARRGTDGLGGSAAGSTPGPAAWFRPSRSSPAARRSFPAAMPRPPWGASVAWAAAGSPPAAPTCPGSPRA